MTFKAVFLAVFAGLLLEAVRVSRTLRGRPDATVDQTAHELTALRVLRPILGMVFYLGLADWLLPGQRLEWAHNPLPPPVRLIGGAVLTGGVALIGWSFRSLGDQYRGGIGLWADHELVTDGAYRWTQHPIYTGFVLAMIGLWGLSANWIVGISGLMLTTSIPALRLPREEEELMERFGEEYERYARETPRFLPLLAVDSESRK